MNFVYIFIFFIAIYTTRVNTGDTDVSDELSLLAKDFAKKIADEHETRILWVELYGKRSELDQYPGVKVDVRNDDLRYGKVEENIQRPGIVFTQRFVNKQSVPVKIEFTRKAELKSTFTWSSSTKFNHHSHVSTQVKVPGLVEVTTNRTLDLELASGKSEGVEETEMFETKQTIEVPANTTVKANLIVTNKFVKIPWTADIHITGQFAYWTYHQIKKKGSSSWHYLHFPTVSDLANEKFEKDGDNLLLRAKGMFKAVKGVDTYLKVIEVKKKKNGIPKRHRVQRAKVTYYKPQMIRL